MIFQIKYNLTLNEINYLLDFINSKNDKFCYELGYLNYSFSFIDFLTKNNDFICIYLYDENSPKIDLDYKNDDSLYGFILARKTKLYIQDHMSIDINIKKMTKEFSGFEILYIDFIYLKPNFNTNFSFNTIKDKLKDEFEYYIYNISRCNQSFLCKKYYYYRPIILDILDKINILNKHILTDTFTKVFNTFTYPMNFNQDKIIKFNPVINEDEMKLIEKRLLLYQTFNFQVFNLIEYKEILNIFQNNAFYKFLIYDSYTNELSDFVCLVSNEYLSSFQNDGNKCINAHFYTGFFNYSDFSDYSDIAYKYHILEYICYYAKQNNLFDMMTILDDLTKCKISTKFLKSIKKKYIMENNLNLNKKYLEKICLSIQ